MKETWDDEEWKVTIILCFILPPVGIAMLLRKWTGRRVFRPDPEYDNELKNQEVDE